MSQAPDSQNLYYPRGNNTNVGIYGAVPKKNHSNTGSNNNNSRFIPNYQNHAKLIQDHLNEVKVVKVAGNPRNTTYMWEEYNHYNEIEKIAEERQKLILENIKSVNGGSKRKTRKKT